MSEVAKLFVTVGIKKDGLEKGLKGISGKMKGFGTQTTKAGKGMTKGLTVPILGAATAMFGLASKHASAGDKIAKSSTKLGVSTDALQEMDYWAGQNGISSDSMERAVGRLNQRVGRAADGNEKYAEAFEGLGVAVRDANGDIRDTELVMQDTIAALRDVEDPALRSAKASEIFGTKMARDLMPALEDGSLSLEDAAKKVHELGGVMSEDAVRAAEKFEDTMDDLKREAGGLFREFATGLIPVITDKLVPAIRDHVLPAISNFIDRIKDIGKWFNDLSPEWKKTIGYAIGFAVVIGPILVIVGKVISVIGALAGAFAFLLSPIGLIIAAIAAVIGIFVYLYKNNEEFRDKVNAIWEQVKEIAVKVFNAIKDVIKNVMEWITAFWEKHGERILDFAVKVFEQIWTVIETVMGVIKGIIDVVMGAISGDWVRVWEGISTIFSSIWSGIKATAERWLGGVRDAIVERLNAAWEYIKGIPSQAIQWGKDIISGLIEGVKAMGKKLIDGVMEPVKNAIDGVKNFLGISSPSKLFAGFGENMGEGLSQGMEKMKGAVSDASLEMTGEATVSHNQPGEMTPRKQEIGGTIRIEGADSQGAFMGAVDVLIEQLGDDRVARKVNQVIGRNQSGANRARGATA